VAQRRVAAADAIGQQLDGEPRHVVLGRRHRRQRRERVAGGGDVVVAHDRQLRRHTHSGRAGRAQAAQRHQIARDEHGRRPPRPGQQARKGRVAAGAREFVVHDAVRRQRQASLRHRAHETADAFARARQVGRAGHAGNVAVAQFDQMARGRIPALFLAGPDQVGVEAGQRALQLDDGHGLAAQQQVLFVVGAAGDEHQPVDALFHQQAQIGRLLLRAAMRVAQDDVVAELERRVLDPADQFGEIGIRRVRHEHADGIRLVVLEAAGDGARNVAHLVDDAQHAPAPVVAVDARVVDNVRNRGDRHPGALRYLLHGRHRVPS
jgi:hypothetical protein